VHTALTTRSYTRIEVLSPVQRRWLALMLFPHNYGVINIRIVRLYPEERMMRLLDLMAALSTALTVDQVCAIILEHCLAALGGQAGWVALLDERESALARAGTGVAAPGSFPIPERVSMSFWTPMTDCVRARQTVYIDKLSDIQTRYPHLVRASPVSPGYSVLCAPLAAGGQMLGAIEIDLLRDCALRPSDCAFAAAMAQQAAQVLDRARLYEEATQARRAAETANALKDRFLAMVSHELRTPLSSILGFASTLLSPEMAVSAESQREYMEIIQAESLALKDLIDNLLDVSRLQAGSLLLRRDPAALSDILAGLRPRLETLASQHHLRIDAPESLPPLLGDGQRVAQVITNLVDNAAKYSPPGASITISAAVAGDILQVSVGDEGPGIPAEARAYVFEPFRQLDSQEGKGRGAGLGLAICRGLVEAHGGRIWVEDRQAPGATITFTLPLADPP
jgi:two-component system sensor histidine kinase KdpD